MRLLHSPNFPLCAFRAIGAPASSKSSCIRSIIPAICPRRNPLSKMPTLLPDDGQSWFDGEVIADCPGIPRHIGPLIECPGLGGISPEAFERIST